MSFLLRLGIEVRRELPLEGVRAWDYEVNEAFFCWTGLPRKRLGRGQKLRLKNFVPDGCVGRSASLLLFGVKLLSKLVEVS